jgi:hypothetical protein
LRALSSRYVLRIPFAPGDNRPRRTNRPPPSGNADDGSTGIARRAGIPRRDRGRSISRTAQERRRNRDRRDQQL